MENLVPKNYGEEVALFRSQLIGGLINRTMDHGELIDELRKLSKVAVRPPRAKTTRCFSVPTLERWYYRFKRSGLAALVPQPRSDRGRAQQLSSAQRILVCDIRREHPGASASLILQVLEADGRIEKGLISATTLRRLLAEAGLDRVSLRNSPGATARLRWEASHPGALWHGDVCHGPSLASGSRKLPLRIHGMLDDASRYVVTLEACHTEREADMLSLLVATIRRHGGRPDALYLDNGATYSGEALATFCARLGMSLVHARPYDPQARGKMERFWRTLREQLLDYIDRTLPLEEITRRLQFWLARHYHVQAHGSLFGKTPEYAWGQGGLTPVTEDELRAALLVRERRRVSKDCVLSIEGRLFEIRQGFLAGRLVDVSYSLLDGVSGAVVEHDGRRFELAPVEPRANSNQKRPPIREHEKPATPVAFDPAAALIKNSDDEDMPF
jgi:transposase InsO family protein